MRLTSSEFIANQMLPFSLIRRDPQGAYPQHQHEFTEMVLVLGGHGTHLAGQNRYEVAAGDVFIVSPGTVHAYEDVHELSLVNFVYDENRLNLPLGGLRALPGYHALFRLEPQLRREQDFASRLRLDKPTLTAVRVLINRIEGEVTAKKEGYTCLALAWFMELLVLVSRAYGAAAHPASLPLLRLGEAISMIERNFREEIALEDLAELAHMSQNTLLRAFRKATGFTPIAYQMELRLRLARQMLSETDLPLTEIAYACGFGDSNYFSRQFSRHCGLAPSLYRRQKGIRAEG